MLLTSGSLPLFSLSPKPKPLNPEPLNPKRLNPKPSRHVVLAVAMQAGGAPLGPVGGGGGGAVGE